MARSFRGRTLAASAAVVAAGMTLAACGGGSSSSSSSGGGGKVSFDAGSTSIVNASTQKGGTLRFGSSGDFDSMDPGNTYYAFSWDFSRLYGRPLVTFKKGAGAPTLTPDLATGLGEHSADLKTWTYHIRQGLKFSDGTPITAADVKYAVARSNYAPEVINQGPTYFNLYLENPNNYKGPYKDSNLDDFKGITTPDDYTVVFHLKQAFSEFDQLVSLPQTDPVPPAADKGSNGGTNYEFHMVSSGPYVVQNYTPGKSATLVPNPNWSATTDPNVSQLPDKITVQFNMVANTLDNELLNGQLDVDLSGTGVQAAARAKILANPKLKANADDPVSGFEWYLPLDSKNGPLSKLACRQAVEYAVDKTAVLPAFGGPAGGDIASTVLPPTIPGYQKSDLYATSGSAGDAGKAKQLLAECGQPNGFSMTMGFRSDRPKEQQVAQAVQQSLKMVGINLTLQGYPSNTYTNAQLGSPSFMQKNNIGLGTYGWGADFPTGFGYMDQILDGSAIKPTGNSNISQLNDPIVNSLFTKAIADPDATARAADYTQIDQEAMKQAAIVPLIYAKSLTYRPTNVTNVYFSQGMTLYDYANMGVKQ